MADPQQIVENIRAAVAAANAAQTPPVADLAAAYAGLCAEANARLHRCLDYLRQGMRGEAIHLAETPPNLLQTTAALDFPERRQWESLCLRYNLPTSPPLRIEAAQELNESYAADAALRDLLTKQRRLALRRAPLRERMEVLRELARQDASNPCWDQDLRALEAARVGEMQAEAASALASNDAARVKQLLHELQQTPWRYRVPAELSEELEAAAQVHRAAAALAHLQALAGPLELARTQEDYDQAVALRGQWHAVSKTLPQSFAPELHHRLQPVFDWISLQTQQRHREEEFDAACSALQLGLAGRAPNEELERLYQAVRDTELELPHEIKARYASLLHARQRAARMARLRNLSIAAALALAFLAALGWLVAHEMRERQAQRLRGQLSAALDQKDLEQSSRLWQTMLAQSPWLVERPEFRELKSHLDDALAADQLRSAEFHRHMDAAKAAGIEGAAQDELAAADQTARGSVEKAEVDGLRAAITQAAEQRRAAAAASFATQFAALKDDANALDDKLLAEDPEGFGQRLVADEAAAQKLVALASQAGMPNAAAALTGVAGQLTHARQRLMETSAERVELQAVRDATGSAAALVASLKAFTDHFPDSTHTRAFKASLALAPAWEAAEAWAGLVAGWSGTLMPTSLADAAQRLASVKEYARQHPVSPLAAEVENYAQYLAQAQRSAAGDAAWRADVFQLMGSPLIADITVIKTTHGDYYMKSDGKFTHTSLGSTFPAILSNDASQSTTVTVKDADLLGKPAPSPQTLLAKAVLAQMQNATLANWETAPLTLAQLVRDQPELDPVLKVVMLAQMLKVAQAGGWRLDDTLKESLAKLTELHAEEAMWVNPADAGAQTLRAAAQAAVASLPPFADLAAAALAQRDRMLNALRFTLAGEGVLFWTPAGWQIETHHAALEAEQAVIVIGTEPTRAEFLSVGKARGGHWALEEEKLRMASEGTLVFICAPPAASP